MGELGIVVHSLHDAVTSGTLLDSRTLRVSHTLYLFLLQPPWTQHMTLQVPCAVWLPSRASCDLFHSLRPCSPVAAAALAAASGWRPCVRLQALVHSCCT